MSLPDERRRLRAAKRAFVTRNVRTQDMYSVAMDDGPPRPGDLILARVISFGKHKKLELVSGRRAQMHADDEIIVSYGCRYAPAQFESMTPSHNGPCDLVAAGGIASSAVCWHDSILEPTSIEPIGYIRTGNGRRINLQDYATPHRKASNGTPIIAVLGGSMNAGKTTTAAALISGLKKCGHTVGAAKLTGTGAGGDVWKMLDAGADFCLDFTDVGFSSTYRVDLTDIEIAAETLIGTLQRKRCSVIVVEVADGIYQRESAYLVSSDLFSRLITSYVFAAESAASAAAGVQFLSAYGRVCAISGKLTMSPLAIREATEAVALPVLTVDDLTQMDFLTLAKNTSDRFQNSLIRTHCTVPLLGSSASHFSYAQRVSPLILDPKLIASSGNGGVHNGSLSRELSQASYQTTAPSLDAFDRVGGLRRRLNGHH